MRRFERSLLRSLALGPFVLAILTRELEGTERLDHLLARQGSASPGNLPVRDRRELLRGLALMVKRMHLSGLNHRDLYLCHLLVKRSAPSTWHIYCADLHRADQRDRMRLRWKVKDLAALNYSADAECVSRTDRLRFMHLYRGEASLDRPFKPLIRKIVRKTERIRAHDRRTQRKQTPNHQAGNMLCARTF